MERGRLSGGSRGPPKLQGQTAAEDKDRGQFDDPSRARHPITMPRHTLKMDMTFATLENPSEGGQGGFSVFAHTKVGTGRK